MEELRTLESFGLYLQEQRQQRGLTAAELAKKTKIPPEQVEALENGQPITLPSVILKGFIRAYAMEVELNPELLVGQYKMFLGEPQDALTLKPSFRSSRQEEGGVKKNFFILAAVLAIILVIGGFYATPYIKNRFIGNNEVVEGNSAAALTALSNNGQAVGQAADNPERATPAAENNQPEPTPQPEGVELKLAFTKDAWLQIRVDGGPIEHGKYKAGQEKIWRGKNNILVRVDNARAIRVFFNGQEMPARKSDGIADEFTLPPQIEILGS